MDGKALKLRRFLNSANLRVDSMKRSGGGHYKVIATLSTDHGEITRIIVLPSSPSDHRWERNKRAEIRRLFKEAASRSH